MAAGSWPHRLSHEAPTPHYVYIALWERQSTSVKHSITGTIRDTCTFAKIHRMTLIPIIGLNWWMFVATTTLGIKVITPSSCGAWLDFQCRIPRTLAWSPPESLEERQWQAIWPKGQISLHISSCLGQLLRRGWEGEIYILLISDHSPSWQKSAANST
jgi:hypothetical protein